MVNHPSTRRLGERRSTAGSMRGILRWPTALAILVITVTAILVGCTGSPGGDSATLPSSIAVADQAARSDALLAQQLTADQPGCSAAVAIDGRVVWAGARGLANLADGTPLTTITRFDIASVAKQFTATAVLLLSFDGLLQLSDPVSKYLRGLPGWAQRVTVDQLIHHTSGIPDYVDLLLAKRIFLAQPTTQQDALDAIAGVTELSAEPGTEFGYSNSNYVLLAEVVAVAAGRSLPDVLTDRVFTPLGLNMVMSPNLTGPDVATGHWTINGTITPMQARWEQLGDGSIFSTPTELVKWADNYATGQLGGPRLLAAITAGAVRDEQAPGVRYGAGVLVTPEGAISHAGGWAGHMSFLTISPDRHTAVAAACNSESGIDFEQVFGGIQAIWFE